MTAEDPEIATYRVFVRNLMLQCSIGVYEHEHNRRQPVRACVDLRVVDRPVEDDFRQVFNYERVVEAIRSVGGKGHVGLLETLAERIAASCLEDSRVLELTVQLEKLAVFPDAESVGIEITRRQPDDAKPERD